jgi:hypothetical protein
MLDLLVNDKLETICKEMLMHSPCICIHFLFNYEWT